MNIYQKIFEARKYIATNPIKKKGKSKNYNYYAPDQVDELALMAFEKIKIDAHFQLLRDSNGLYGHLKVINLEALEEQVEYIFRTDVPNIPNSNITQQYGGAVTYTKRYMLMNLLSIFDAELDFDDPNSPIAPTNPKNLKTNNKTPELKVTPEQVKLFWIKAREYNMSEEKVRKLLSLYNLTSTKDIPVSLLNELIARMEAKFKEGQNGSQNGALTH